MYILHYNTNDRMLREGNSVVEFRPYLSDFFEKNEYCALFYHPTLGPHVYCEEVPPGLKSLKPIALRRPGAPEKGRIEHVQKFLPRVEGQLFSAVEMGRASEGQEQWRNFCLVLDALDDLVPDGRLHEGRLTSLTLRRWALDGRIHDANTVIVLIARHLANVDRTLYDPANRIHVVRVPPPTAGERSRLFHAITQAGAFPSADSDLDSTDGRWTDESITAITNLTGGLGIYQCEGIGARARARNQKVNGALIKEVKAEVIRDTTGDLLEFEDTEATFAHIGGLDGIKQYLRQVSEDLADGSLVNVPKGILLAGPPGTGKTILAEALANESHMNLVRMGNIRSKWVGESERNLELALGVVEDLAPVVVFVDEIDQAFQRGKEGGGGSGVGERIFKRILEVMGDDDRRGRIIWVAATNRADILDDALLRRFDRIFPVLLPGNPLAIARILAVQELRLRGEMYFALPAISVERGQTDPEKRTEAVAQELQELAATFTGCSGSELEVLVRHAVEKARAGGAAQAPIAVTEDHLRAAWANFKRNHDELMYDAQSLLAIQSCNFKDLLPKPEEVSSSIREVVAEVLQSGGNGPIDRWLVEHGFQHQLHSSAVVPVHSGTTPPPPRPSDWSA